MTSNDPYTEAIRSVTFSRIVLPALCVIGLFAGAALAQQPTAAQQSAIKSACRSDFMAQCSGVQPGGQAALSCLQQHSSSLSSGCQQALSALGSSKSAPAATTTAPATATPAAPTPSMNPREEMAIAREACGPDFRALCAIGPAWCRSRHCLPPPEHEPALASMSKGAVIGQVVSDRPGQA